MSEVTGAQKNIALRLNKINTHILEYTQVLVTIAEDPDEIYANIDVFIQELSELKGQI